MLNNKWRKKRTDSGVKAELVRLLKHFSASQFLRVRRPGGAQTILVPGPNISRVEVKDRSCQLANRVQDAQSDASIALVDGAGNPKRYRPVGALPDGLVVVEQEPRESRSKQFSDDRRQRIPSRRIEQDRPDIEHIGRKFGQGMERIDEWGEMP